MNAAGIGALIRDKRIIVCCGAGGVGKTTTAAATALAAARAGRKVLVLTIDPSRRLAETLGVSRNPKEPVRLSAERTAAAGITTGSLDAWLLDPKLVSDQAVHRLSKTPDEAERFLNNRIYQQLTAMIAGLHEYTAMEELHRLVKEQRYDLVVLDTPPSRNALDFLESPGRLARLLDGRVFQALLPKKGSLLTRAASKVIERLLSLAFGDDFAEEFTLFMMTFGGLFHMLSRHVSEMRESLSRPDVAFVLVCSPAAATLTEVFFFQEKTRELNLPFRGFVLNRSRARTEGRAMPAPEMLGPSASPDALSALSKLATLAELEQKQAANDQRLLGDLGARAGAGAFAIAVPNLAMGADDMSMLTTVADVLMAS